MKIEKRSGLALIGSVVAILFILVLSASASTALDSSLSLASSSASVTAFIRVNQVGFLPNDYKPAVLISSSNSLKNAQFEVLNSSSGSVVFEGEVGASLGEWNTNYPFTFPINFTALNSTGNFFIRLVDNQSVVSPTFQIGSAANLYQSLLPDALFFYQAQQDGPIVNSSVLDRQPSHLTDENATVYDSPVYQGAHFKGDLIPIGGPVDVAGGWFDAGDYLKFVETASYTDAVMLFALRSYPTLLNTLDDNFSAEALFGLNWLQEMWNQTTKTLYYQVGIGEGNSSILGDHDIWRLPQADDALNVSAGSKYYFIKYRPVFEAGPPGSEISPNLAGRVATDFALCYQVYYRSDPSYAKQCLVSAETVFSLANTTLPANCNAAHNCQLLTTDPHNFYPQTSWQGDLELGATELYYALAIATNGIGPRPSGLLVTNSTYYLEQAAHWAHEYITGPENGEDSLNLYDVSAWAHYELYHAIQQAGNPKGLQVTESQLLNDIGYQLNLGEKQAGQYPFGVGVPYGDDATPHALGYVMEATFYDELSNSTKYAQFGEMERDWVFGDNAWGVSFVVGVGSTFPDCLQHQVANLVGSHDGKPPLLYGATVDGPNSPSSFKGLGNVTGMLKCPPGGGDPYAQFTGHGGRYFDNVIAWPSTEPADDYTALTILIYASAGNLES